MTERRRIAVVGACPFPVPQGSQVYLRETALQYRREGHEVHLVVYGYGSDGDLPDIPIHRCPNVPFARKTQAGPSWAKPLLDLMLALTLRRIVQRHNIDLIDAHNYEGLLVTLFGARGRPVTYHAHNAMADELPYYFGHARCAERLGAWLDRTFPKRADRVITPHARLKDYLVEAGCHAEAVEIAAPRIDPLPLTGERAFVAHPPMLYAGNLDRYQNLGLLADVMRRVQAARPEIELIVGTAASAGAPEGALDGARIVPTPDRGALAAALDRDAVFVCPRTSWSGYPIKLLNALAAGLPVVCCASSAYPIEHGVNGLIVPDDDAEAFAEAVLQIAGDAAFRRRCYENRPGPGRVQGDSREQLA